MDNIAMDLDDPFNFQSFQLVALIIIICSVVLGFTWLLNLECGII